MSEEITCYIQRLDGQLMAAVELTPAPSDTGAPDAWRLDIKLTYHGDPAGHTSFNLHGYSQQEAEQVARNIRSNAYIMKEIDEQLWGESD